MGIRPWIGIATACGVLAFAACDGTNLFVGGPGTNGGVIPGTGAIQGSVMSGGTGLGAVPVILVNQDSTSTGLAGAFQFDSLPPAVYALTVRVPIGYALAAGQTGTRSVSVSSGAVTGVTIILQRTTTVNPSASSVRTH